MIPKIIMLHLDTQGVLSSITNQSHQIEIVIKPIPINSHITITSLGKEIINKQIKLHKTINNLGQVIQIPLITSLQILLRIKLQTIPNHLNKLKTLKFLEIIKNKQSLTFNPIKNKCPSLPYRRIQNR